MLIEGQIEIFLDGREQRATGMPFELEVYVFRLACFDPKLVWTQSGLLVN